jgi:hypothetical protein
MISAPTVHSSPRRGQFQDIAKLLSLKADREQVNQLVDGKANKQDMQMQLKAVEILQQQLSLVIILLMECVRGG